MNAQLQSLPRVYLVYSILRLVGQLVGKFSWRQYLATVSTSNTSVSFRRYHRRDNGYESSAITLPRTRSGKPQHDLETPPYRGPTNIPRTQLRRPQHYFNKHPYRYEPLHEKRQIRLVVIHQSPKISSDIVVSLRRVNLGEPGSQYTREKYLALSYAWGKGQRNRPVYVRQRNSGRGRESTITVTPDLEVALRHLRNKHEDVTFWVDSICIDQANIAERSQQVALMSDIYRQALEVVIWLGPRDDDSNQALGLLSYIGQQAQAAWSRSEGAQLLWAGVAPWGNKSKPIDWSFFGNPALPALLRCPWFERLWVRQEVLVSKNATIHVGFDTLPWLLFRDAIWCLHRQPWITPTTQGIKETTKELRSLLKVAHGISYAWGGIGQTLRSTSSCMCSDPRDCVYAVSALLQPALDLEPDYSQSTAEVYRSATRRWIDQFNDLDILGYNEGQRNEPNLPSWCLDFSKPPRTIQRFYDRCEASSNTLPILGDTSDKRVLRVAGIHVSDIVRSRPLSNWKHYEADEYRIENIRRLTPASILSPGQEKLLDAYCYLLCNGLLVENILSVHKFEDVFLLEETRHILSSLLQPIPVYDCAPGPRIAKFLEFSTGACVGRAAIETGDGRIGLGPLDTQPGDIICILFGCSWPIVLRRVTDQTSSDQKHYTVVGSALVPGLMVGEGVFGPIPDDFAEVGVFNPDDDHLFSIFFNNETRKVQSEHPRSSVILPRHGTYRKGLDERVNIPIEDLNQAGLPVQHFDLV
ncbi:Fc.00g080630.m01.CDS01 [Cosmosporella sp. VM-42]